MGSTYKLVNPIKLLGLLEVSVAAGLAKAQKCDLEDVIDSEHVKQVAHDLWDEYYEVELDPMGYWKGVIEK